MEREKGVLPQNAGMRSEIAQCARLAASGDQALSWLPVVLQAHGIDPSKGILAAYSERDHPKARLCTGTWLTASGDFWEFQVLVPNAAGDAPIVRFFDERSVSVFAHERGIAKSFGALAIEVRDEILGK